MKRKLIGLVVATAIMLLGAGLTTAARAQGEPVNLKIASFNVGGSWYIYATTIAELATKALPEGSNVEVLPYQGGVGNPILVNRGEADMGLSFSALSNWARQGKITFKEAQPDIRALVGGLNTPHRLGIVVRSGAGISSLQDIKDKKMPVRLVTVQIGGAGEALARMALESYGMSYDDLKSWGGSVTHTDLPVAIQQMRDGQADIFIHNIGYRQPDVMELALGGNIKFIALGDKQRQMIAEKYGLQPDLAIRAGEFAGVKKDVPSVGYPTGVIANKDMPDEVAYRITKAICENPNKLAEAHASLKAFKPEKAGDPLRNGGVPLHAGAEKYYREKGWM